MNSADKAFSAVIDHQFDSLLTVLRALEPRPQRALPQGADDPQQLAVAVQCRAKKDLSADVGTVDAGDLR